MTTLAIDFETASQADLTKIGAKLYAEHPSTRILCMAYSFGNGPVDVWVPGQPLPPAVIDHVANDGLVSGWNVKFEWYIWNLVLCRTTAPVPLLRHTQLDDTMARAAFWGLPLSLDKAGVAMGISNLKSKSGHALMMRMCRPRHVDPATGAVRWWHEEDAQMLADLIAYCRQDVLAERELASKLPPLPARERRIWDMDLRINNRGVPVDPSLAMRMRDIAAVAKKRLDHRMKTLTQGRVNTTNQTALILAEAQAHGYPGHDLRKDTLKELLPRVEDRHARAVLTLRQEAARTSTAKLNALLNACGPDERVYGMLQHYGAIRTGRWAGRLLQPQNIPRPVIKNVDAAVAAIMAGATDGDLELLFSASTMGVLASCLRATIAAGPGKVLVSADLSQIEARVVAWLAGQLGILQVFASGQDPYVYTANQIGSNDRQLGKVMVLALGFGMGVNKFIETAKTYGIRLGVVEAEEIVNAWRAANQHIVQFWWDCDRAARQIAMATLDMAITVGMVTFRRRGGSMLIELPSGRPLVYRGIQLVPSGHRTGQYDIAYFGLNQYTNRWELIRTYGGKLVENITQAVARDVMADGLLDIDHARLADLVLTVHDEAIAEVRDDRGQPTLDHMLACLTAPRAWTKGLPVDAAGWIGPRYKKG